MKLESGLEIGTDHGINTWRGLRLEGWATKRLKKEE
jgi:hypothetical protein